MGGLDRVEILALREASYWCRRASARAAAIGEVADSIRGAAAAGADRAWVQVPLSDWLHREMLLAALEDLRSDGWPVARDPVLLYDLDLGQAVSSYAVQMGGA